MENVSEILALLKMVNILLQTLSVCKWHKQFKEGIEDDAKLRQLKTQNKYKFGYAESLMRIYSEKWILPHDNVLAHGD